MGPCKDCGQWHCFCFLVELMKTKRQRQEILKEHRELAAKHDPDFQRFMLRVKGLVA